MRTFFLLIIGILIAFFGKAQQNITDSLLHQGLQRQYIVHQPSSYDGSNSTPIVLTLHGGSGNAQTVQYFTQMNYASNANDFLAVYPEGHTEIDSASYVWADGRGTAADMNGIDDVGFIDKLIDTLMADYNVDPSRIYICGFSNGGFMTQRIACETPERFAAMGGLGCSMDTGLYANCSPSKPIPMMVVAGTADPEVPYDGGSMSNPNVPPVVAVDSAVQFWVDHNNCSTAEPKVDIPDSVQSDSCTVDYFRYTDCDCNADVRFYKVIGGGHTWPGVEIASLEPTLGETNEDMHASFQLWDFFQAHPKCSSSAFKEHGKNDPRVRLFPNPTRDRVTVRSEAKMDKLFLYDRSGRKLRATQKRVLDLSELSTGLYWLRIETAEGRILTQKLVKQ